MKHHHYHNQEAAPDHEIIRLLRRYQFFLGYIAFMITVALVAMIIWK